MGTLKYTCSGIRSIIRYEGVQKLVLRVFVSLFSHMFWFEEYYIIFTNTHRDPEENEIDFLPKINNYCLKILTTNKEADNLLAEGFTFGAYEMNLRARFDKDVVSFCLFVDKEFAHVSCLADNPRGKAVVDSRPFNVDYQNGEVVVGRAHTIPKFRRLHLQEYNGYKFRKYCRERGISRVISSVNSHNIAALGEMPGAPDRHVISKCQLFKVLWFTHLNEIKMANVTLKQIVAKMTKNN